MRSVVVLPAPLGPSRPVMQPSGALKLTSFTARIGGRRAGVQADQRQAVAGCGKTFGEVFDDDHGVLVDDAPAESGRNAAGRGIAFTQPASTRVAALSSAASMKR